MAAPPAELRVPGASARELFACSFTKNVAGTTAPWLRRLRTETVPTCFSVALPTCIRVGSPDAFSVMLVKTCYEQQLVARVGAG